ncbi:MAG: hypothetical protein EP302_02150 [Bacteroidetes bacterium]|jgi:hypothetical protein|nr:MAG: hypothetical protein EP302_02150 [Bacteroidota bacterium]UCE70094.1 MAG: hypothetical protein JSW57_04140 [Flavobacteriaceae bacterium]
MKACIGITLFILGLMSCSSQKALESHPPFSVERPTVQYWEGGREESGSGMRFRARWNPKDPSAVQADSLFFRGRVYKLEVYDSETGFILEASRTDAPLEKPDMIMHADSTKEIGNQPPKSLPSSRSFPFELTPDEAVISYILRADGEKYYTKITGVIEKAPLIYPGRPQH